MNPTVSVIMPVRNGGKYLETAVNSILGQSFSSLELILVDDHSNDDAINGLSKADPRLVLLENPERGVSSAFNSGLFRARGEFIARMDSDDISMPARIARQCSYFQSHPEVDICGGRVEIFADGEVAGGNVRYQAWLNACCSPAEISRELFIESPIPNPTAMFRREAILRLGGYGDPCWPEDYDLFLRADALGMQMGKPEHTLLRWREHEKRLTRTDERYALKRFQAAKAHFLSKYRLPGKGPVVLWGAGPSGRLMHDLLVREGTRILGFLDVHPRRTGGEKRGLPVWPVEQLDQLKDTFILVAVGAPGARSQIRDFMRQRALSEGEHFLFVA
jgi:glycosyltransferase involved in cell wall biosynthesis